ncbi:MAG: Bacterial regulatory protein luxR family [Frankiaceae bacterium]|nr:Bacterial regulatory protein luxR family [Frankiaceae bacterium]
MDERSAAGVSWLLLTPDAVPQDWTHRATPLVAIGLMPEELDRFRRGLPVLDGLPPQDAAVANLVAHGASTAVVARRLNISRRTAERKVASLRRHFGADSHADLVARLARGQL